LAFLVLVNSGKSSNSDDLKELGRSLSRFCKENKNLNHQVLQSYAMDVFVNHPLLLSALKDIFSKNDFWRMNNASSQNEATSTFGSIMKETGRIYRDEIVVCIGTVLTAFIEQRGYYGVKVEQQKNLQAASKAHSITIKKPLNQVSKPNLQRTDKKPESIHLNKYPELKFDSRPGILGYALTLLVISFNVFVFFSQNKGTTSNLNGNNESDGAIKTCVEQVRGYCLYP